MKKVFALITILMIVAVSGCIGEDTVACTEEAKICPDGTAVVRIPPECEFEECPVIEPELNETTEEQNIVYVSVIEHEYIPNEITIPAGTIVVWTNEGTKSHTVSSAHLHGGAGTLHVNESWNYTFDEADRIYNYYDAFYLFKGKVIVE